MRLKKIFFISATIAVVGVFLMIAGCGQKSNELNLPEQETKQLNAAKAGMDKEANPNAIVKAAPASGEFKKFYVYADQGYFRNHYVPSGWMGDYGDLKFNDAWSYDPYSRRTCIRVVYTAEKKQGAGWAGIYWQDPPNNWGNMKGGYDFMGAKKVTFWAKGEKGQEIIAEFKVGGIQGEYSDTASTSIGPVTLTPEWKEYTIDLKNEDLSLVTGGFCFVISSSDNPQGVIFYLDDIAYE